MSELTDIIVDYYELRGLKFPNFDNAMKFVVTELAEVLELDLDRIGGWTRNHPESKPKYNKEDMAEELGDAIMMLIVAGIADGVDPIDALVKKIKRKLSTTTPKDKLDFSCNYSIQTELFDDDDKE